MRTCTIIPEVEQVQDEVSDSSPTYISEAGYPYSIRQSDDWNWYLVTLVRQKDVFELDYDEQHCYECMEQAASDLGIDSGNIACQSLYKYSSYYSNLGCNVTASMQSFLLHLRSRLLPVSDQTVLELCCWVVQLVTDLNRFDTETLKYAELEDKFVSLSNEFIHQLALQEAR